MNDWQESEALAPFSAGDVGGDIQYGEAYSRRWTRPAPGDMHAFVEIMVYAAKDDEAQWLQQDFAFGLTRDPAHPFDGEVWTGDSNGESVPGPVTNEGARAACERFNIDDVEFDGVVDGINGEEKRQC